MAGSALSGVADVAFDNKSKFADDGYLARLARHFARDATWLMSVRCRELRKGTLWKVRGHPAEAEYAALMLVRATRVFRSRSGSRTRLGVYRANLLAAWASCERCETLSGLVRRVERRCLDIWREATEEELCEHFRAACAGMDMEQFLLICIFRSTRWARHTYETEAIGLIERVVKEMLDAEDAGEPADSRTDPPAVADKRAPGSPPAQSEPDFRDAIPAATTTMAPSDGPQGACELWWDRGSINFAHSEHRSYLLLKACWGAFPLRQSLTWMQIEKGYGRRLKSKTLQGYARRLNDILNTRLPAFPARLVDAPGGLRWKDSDRQPA